MNRCLGAALASTQGFRGYGLPPRGESQQAQHQKIKSAFSAMLFELFGNKSLTDTCIRFPVCSAEQPAYVLKQFGEAWEAAKDSMEVQKAREHSQPNMEIRLSKQIRALQKRAERAAWIAERIAEDWNNLYQLSLNDQELWLEHHNGAIRRQIPEHRAQQQARIK